MEDDAIFKNRIQIDERLVKRLSKRAVTVFSTHNSLQQEQRTDQIELLHTELLQFEFSVKKVEKMIQVANQEMEHYKSEQKRLDDEINSHQGRVADLKKTLDNAQSVEKNKKEYDVIAASIGAFPARPHLLSQIEDFDNQAAVFKKSQFDLEEMIQNYKTEISSCFTSLGKSIENLSLDITNNK